MGRVSACLVCGEALSYFAESREMECVYCHKKFMSNAACGRGHYVCDSCHAKKAISDIKEMCEAAKSRDPLEIAAAMMKNPYIHMHGPENHVLVGAALLAAYANSGGEVNVAPAVEELAKRGSQVPGGACGFWGCCGAAVSAGIFASVVTGATPMADEAYGLCNQLTAACLAAIGEIGGPRCCKRNAFLAIGQAVKFCREKLNVEMTPPGKYICEFSARNGQCIGRRCPFNAARD